jgi:WD40 repeat protein
VAVIVARNLADAAYTIDPSDIAWRANLPRTPVDAVRWDLRSRFDPNDVRRAEELLAPLAHAQGAGLPWERIWAPAAAAASGRGYTDEDLVWLRRAAGWYVLEVAEGRRLTYRISHRCVTEYLRSTHDATKVHAAIATALSRQVPLAIGRGGRDWAQADPYTRMHLATHAAAAGGLLDELLVDPRFLLAADRGRLLTAASAVAGREARAAAEAYRRTVGSDPAPSTVVSQLELAAHCAGADTLAAALRPGGAVDLTARAWSTLWARWSAPRPHRTLTAGHTGGVLALATVRVGTRTLAATGGDDGTLRVWDLAAGRPVGPPLQAHAGAVRALATAVLDGRAVAVSGGEDGTTYLWNLETGESTPIPLEAGRAVTALATVRLGQRVVAIAGVDDGTLRAWDLPSRRPYGPPLPAHTGAVRAIATATVDGLAFAVTAGEDGIVRGWDVATGLPLGPPLAGLPGGVGVLAMLADLRPAVVTGDGDGGLQMWDLATLHRIPGPVAGRVGALDAVAAFVHEGRPAALTAGQDRTIRLWDLPTGQPVGEPMAGHTGRITGLSYVDGEVPVAVTASTDGTVRIWELPADEAHRPAAAVTGVASLVADRGHVLAGCDDGTVHVLDLPTGGVLAAATVAHAGAVTAIGVATVQGRQLVATGGADGRVRRWDLVTGEPVGRPVALGGPGVRAMAVSELGGVASAVVVGDDGTVGIWDLTSGELIPAPALYKASGVTAVATAVVGHTRFVVTGTADGQVTGWNLSGGKLAGLPIGSHTGPVSAVAVAPAGVGLAVVSGGADRTVRRWDVRVELRPTRRFRRSGGGTAIAVAEVSAPVTAAALRFSAAGAAVVAAAADTDVYLWAAARPAGSAVGSAVGSIAGSAADIDGEALRIVVEEPVTAMALATHEMLVVGTGRGVVTVTTRVWGR